MVMLLRTQITHVFYIAAGKITKDYLSAQLPRALSDCNERDFDLKLIKQFNKPLYHS